MIAHYLRIMTTNVCLRGENVLTLSFVVGILLGLEKKSFDPVSFCWLHSFEANSDF